MVRERRGKGGNGEGKSEGRGEMVRERVRGGGKW
jgi:hypothetical protein